MGKEECTGCWWGNLRVRGHWEDPDVDESIILRWMFGKLEGLRGLDGVGSGQGQVEGTREYGKELSGSIKIWGIS
jgi:hypothetical protein